MRICPKIKSTESEISPGGGRKSAMKAITTPTMRSRMAVSSRGCIIQRNCFGWGSLQAKKKFYAPLERNFKIF